MPAPRTALALHRLHDAPAETAPLLHRLRRWAKAATAVATAAADALCRAWTVRRILRELREMPDYRLRDIGLARSEIEAAVRGLDRAAPAGTAAPAGAVRHWTAQWR